MITAMSTHATLKSEFYTTWLMRVGNREAMCVVIKALVNKPLYLVDFLAPRIYRFVNLLLGGGERPLAASRYVVDNS